MKNEEFDIVLSPLTFDTENAPGNMQLELIELQCDSTLKEKFKTERIDRFYVLLNKSKFVNLKKMDMNINKSKLRSNQSLLRNSTNILPDIKQLVKNFDDPQMSH